METHGFVTLKTARVKQAALRYMHEINQFSHAGESLAKTKVEEAARIKKAVDNHIGETISVSMTSPLIKHLPIADEQAPSTL